MKRLKYRCLLGGKTYPAYVICALLFLMLFGSIEFPPLLALLPFALIGALGICIFLEHSLSDSERRMVSRLEYPLWQSMTPEIRQLVISQQESTQIDLTQLIIAASLVGGMGFLFVSVPPRNGHSMLYTHPAIPFLVFAFVGILAFIFLLIRKGIGANWLDMDDSAVWIKVPIDHMYDVTHHNHGGRYAKFGSCDIEWTKSYLVFYLPDGKYILPVPKGGGESNTVLIVKYGKAVTWLPIYEHHPEDYL